jgi:hypothetical protein
MCNTMVYTIRITSGFMTATAQHLKDNNNNIDESLCCQSILNSPDF